MHTLSDDKKDGYEIGILSLYPHRPEKEHSRNDFLSSGLPHQQARERREHLIIRGKSSINKARECNELLIGKSKITMRFKTGFDFYIVYIYLHTLE